MRGLALLALSLLGMGCQPDTGTFDEDDKVDGVPNPPNLETPVKLDKIKQITTPKVDVLWVIDDSCSMSEEQAKLAENFAAFITFFIDSGLDWHIGVISTDTDNGSKNGKLQGAAGHRYLEASTPNPVGLFAQMSGLGTSGSGDERGRRATNKALTDPLLSGENRGFYRPEASLNIIVISDENDYSANQPTRNEFIDFLTNLKEDPELISFSAIVGPQTGCATAEAGSEYIAVTNAIGGIHESICEEDWVPVLEDLGLQAAGLRREYFLSELPVPGTVDVWVRDGDYTYYGIDRLLLADGSTVADHCETTACFKFDYLPERNSILMEEYVPSPLAEINIQYELLGAFQPEEGDDNPLIGSGGGAVTDTDE
jgi:hypothetical protein